MLAWFPPLLGPSFYKSQGVTGCAIKILVKLLKFAIYMLTISTKSLISTTRLPRYAMNFTWQTAQR